MLAVNYTHHGTSARNLALFVRNVKRTVRFVVRPDGMIFYGAGYAMHGYLVALAQDYADSRLLILHGESEIDSNTRRLVFWLTIGDKFAHARAFKDKLAKAGFSLCVNPREYAPIGRMMDTVSNPYVGGRQAQKEASR